MPARKRQKSTGLTGFIADAISEQRKSAAKTRRRETQAEVAPANVAAKVERRSIDAATAWPSTEPNRR